MNIPLQSKQLASPKSLNVESIEPCEKRKINSSYWFFDFGKHAFATLLLDVEATKRTKAVVHLGEKLTDSGFIDRDPPGCVRYRDITVDLQEGNQQLKVEIPPDSRNAKPPAIRMPSNFFEVLPFRYAEIEICEDDSAEVLNATQLAVFYPFDEAASRFKCNNEKLNRVWELCKYSIKATSFCGVYVDGDRERIPYEADAYINQLCHYGVDKEYEMARQTIEHLLFNPTWPTDWALHCVPMAWADYQYTGRTDLLQTYYDILRRKALLPLAREDWLISTEAGGVTPKLLEQLFLSNKENHLRDLIDWPPGSFTEGGTGERDNYDMVSLKTVINALHIWNLNLLARMAEALNCEDEAAFMRKRAKQTLQALHRVCFSYDRGIFIDGEGSDHASLHANIFPAAFGLLPQGFEKSVHEFIRSRGMVCSVYAAQYLLESCFRLGDADYALDLMTAEHDRSWLNMLRVGSTVTLEAWDWRYKNNLDWNHAWGAAPANIIPRFIAGVRPKEPGFSNVIVAPQSGWLEYFESEVPTPNGPVKVILEEPVNGRRRLKFETPMPAKLDLSGVGEPVFESDMPDEWSPGTHKVDIIPSKE